MPRLIILLLCASVSWGAAFTASVTGDCNDAATFGGSGPPAAGDTITISNGVTLTVPAGVTCPSSGAYATDTNVDASETPAIQCSNFTTGTGKLVVQGTLKVKGPMRTCNATWEVDGGGQVLHAATTNRYSWTTSVGRIDISGTSNANRATIGIEGGALNWLYLGGSAGVGYGQFTIAWASLSNMGTSGVSGAICFRAGSGTASYSITDTLIDSSAHIVNSDGPCNVATSARAFANGDSFVFQRNKVTNTLRADQYVAVLLDNTTAGTTMLIEDSTWRGTFLVHSGSQVGRGCVFNRVAGYSTVGGAIRAPNNSHPGCQITDYLSMEVRASNGSNHYPPGNTSATPHQRWIVARESSNNTDVDAMRFSMGGANGLSFYLNGLYHDRINSQAGDFFVTESTVSTVANTVYQITDAVMPPETTGSRGMQSSMIMAVAGNYSPVAALLKNATLFYTAAGVTDATSLAGENTFAFSGSGGMTAQNNLLWRSSNGAASLTTDSLANTATWPAGSFTADHNWLYNINTSIYQGAGAMYSTTPGTGDVASTDPRFVSTSRTLLGWAQTINPSATTYSDVFDLIEADTSRIRQAYEWLRWGYMTQNPLTWTAGATGGYVGGVDPKPLRMAGALAGIQ